MTFVTARARTTTLFTASIIDKGGKVVIISNALAYCDTAVNIIVKSFIVPVGQISAIRGQGYHTFFSFIRDSMVK